MNVVLDWAVAHALALLWMLPALAAIPRLWRLHTLARRAYNERLLGPPSPTKAAELADLWAYVMRQRWRWTGIAATLLSGSLGLLSGAGNAAIGLCMLVLLMYFPYRLFFEIRSDLRGDTLTIFLLRKMAQEEQAD